MEYVKVNGREYRAQINGVMEDYSWDERESKTIHILEGMTSAEALETFVDNTEWSIISEWEEEVYNEEGTVTGIVHHRDEFDNSDFNLCGDVTDHRDGTVSIKMGKMTDVEAVLEAFLG